MSESSAAQTATKTPIDYADHLTISCSVSDLEPAIAWYRDLLGFELIYKLDDMGWCELRGASCGRRGKGSRSASASRRHRPPVARRPSSASRTSTRRAPTWSRTVSASTA